MPGPSPAAGGLALALFCTAPASASCLVAGDSIAVGLGPALGCVTDARVGLASAAVIARVRPGHGLTVISAGSDDPGNPRLAANLRAARARASGRVAWIVPADAAGHAVRTVAAEHGNRAVAFAPGPDRIHPKSHAALARAIRGAHP